MFPRVLERTNGQLRLITTSFPELGIAGPDVHTLVADGTLAMADIAQYIAGAFPSIEIGSLFGIYPSLEHNYIAMANVTPELRDLAVESTEGGQYISLNWHSGNNVFFFSKDPLDTVDAWKGKKIRTPTAAMSSWLRGMEADAQFMAFTEVYTALERGILEAAMTGGDAGFGQRWYEVTDYINGPVISWDNSAVVMNKDQWDKLPEDFQNILQEEAAINELEELRTATIQHEMGLLKNTNAGLGVPAVLSRIAGLRLRERSAGSADAQLGRAGWRAKTKPIVDVFNEKVGPIVGVKINPDGSVVEAPVTMPFGQLSRPHSTPSDGIENTKRRGRRAKSSPASAFLGAVCLAAAEPAAVLPEGSIVHDHRDAGGFGFGGGFLVNHAVLHPDVAGAYLDGFVHHGRGPVSERRNTSTMSIGSGTDLRSG